MSRVDEELKQYPAEYIVNRADSIIQLTIRLDETMTVVEKFSDSNNGLYGLLWLVKRALVDIEDAATEIRDDAKQREIDSAEVEREAEDRAVSLAPKKKVRS